MAENTQQYYKYLSVPQLVFLLVAGALSVYVPILVTSVWLFIIVSAIYSVIIKDSRWIWYGFAASPIMEVWARMSRAPLLPHEIGKYYLILLLVLLFIQHIRDGSAKAMYHTGGYMLIALLPSILVGLDTFNFEGWVLNVFGILLLAIMIVFSARERWSIEKYCRVIQFGIMPVIPVLVYLTIKTPDFAKIDFTLSSNFKTSGAFGSNQVSTILGVGMIFTMLLMVLRRPLFSLRWLNFLLMAALLYRGFLTFSRGGILTTLVCLVVAIGPAAFTSLRSFLRFTVLLSLFIGFGLVIFLKVNEMTNNQLLLRYKGETIGTLTGSKQRSLNTITSGRTQIASTDIDMFKDHPVFGVGPGMSKDLRPSYGFAAIASHTEYTRLLSEHGIGGLAVVILLFVFPIWWLRRQKYMVWRVAIASIFLFAVLTSLHSAMRTNTTIVCYVLAAIPVYVLHKRKKLANQ
jgi:hypothetical protein